MKLIGSSGNSFALTVLGYQFPELETEPWDSNWLIIQVDVTLPRGSWTATDSSLLTYELEHLAKWFDEIRSGTHTKTSLDFLEPYLAFELIQDKADQLWLRIYFEAFLRPAWDFEKTVNKRDLWVEFPLAEIDLKTAAEALRSQLKHYPQRADR